MLFAATANAADGYPDPGVFKGGAGAFSIQNFGRFPAAAGQVLAGMNDDHGHGFHFKTIDSDTAIYKLECHGSAFNDGLMPDPENGADFIYVPGMRAHFVNVTWYPKSWGILTAGTSVNHTGLPWPLPRPKGSPYSYPNGGTGGTTCANTAGDYRVLGYFPECPLYASGILWSTGIPGIKEEQGGLRKNTEYYADVVVQAVDPQDQDPNNTEPLRKAGGIQGLGTACEVNYAGEAKH